MSQRNPFQDDEDYKSVKMEFECLLEKVLDIQLIYKTKKIEPRLEQFRINVDRWYCGFEKAVEIGGKLSSIHQLELKPENPQLVSMFKMFEYLGLVESLGSVFVDLILLMLIAYGKAFHIERIYDFPRIIHAETLDDLHKTNLATKLSFLEECGLKKTSELINRDLRNDIAHLNFDISEDGVITLDKRVIDIDKKIDEIRKMIMIIHYLLTEKGFWTLLDLQQPNVKV